MTNNEFKNLLNLVVKDGKIEIPSIYMFKDYYLELMKFFEKCGDKGCTVYFKNENWTYDISDIKSRAVAKIYPIVFSGNFLDDYLKYLENIDDMTFDKIIHS